jgi:glycosyltransferase involved in cell wall biosynthesis
LRRAVVIVANPVAPYSRAVRVARTLAASGFEVEIAAQAAPGLPAEERDGDIPLRRWTGSGPWVEKLARETGRPGIGRRLLMKPYRMLARHNGWARRHPPPTLRQMRVKLWWPALDRPWWYTLEHELPAADLYHACGYRALPVALRLADASRARGRAGKVVYDVIDIALESSTFLGRHPFWRWLYQRRERAWARRADAVITVNEALADDLRGRLRLPERPGVLLNTPPRWDPPEPWPNLIRQATGLPGSSRIVVYLGRLSLHRGLEEAAEAVAAVDNAALVLIGFGELGDQERARAETPQYSGRHFTLPAVHPDDVPAWAASADVSLIASPPTSLNQRLSTPNKFWESLAGGTPVVVGQGTIVMRALVEREGIGAVGNPGDPGDLARALRSILDAPQDEQAARRARCLAIAHDRYNWESAVVGYAALVARLVPPTGPAVATG